MVPGGRNRFLCYWLRRGQYCSVHVHARTAQPWGSVLRTALRSPLLARTCTQEMNTIMKKIVLHVHLHVRTWSSSKVKCRGIGQWHEYGHVACNKYIYTSLFAIEVWSHIRYMYIMSVPAGCGRHLSSSKTTGSSASLWKTTLLSSYNHKLSILCYSFPLSLQCLTWQNE